MTRRMLAIVGLVGLIVAGCAAATPAPPKVSVTGPNAGTDTFGNPQVRVTATSAGVSQPFTVTSGRFAIQYLIDSGADSGCDFALLLVTTKDGPIVQSTAAVLPSGAEGAGDVTWTMTAGTYLLQEDETGLLNCQRGFQATITAQN